MKRISTKTTKSVAVAILAAFVACSAVGCSVEKNFTVTETHTETDADGNTTTTTTTNHNGEVTTETNTATADEAKASNKEEINVQEISDAVMYKNVPIEFTNEMGWDIKDLYIKMSSQNEWSDNFLGEDQYIDDGITVKGITLNYTEEEHFMDVRIADSKGEVEEFDAIELPAEGADYIEVVFGYDEVNDIFTATVNAE